MFRPLPLKAVRQKQHEAAQAFPLRFGAGDELIDNHLRRVPEVTELRFPNDQSFRRVETVAVIESKHAHFRKRAVEQMDRGLVRCEVLKWNVFRTGIKIMQHGVPMAEGAALGILPAEAHGMIRYRQR